MSERPGLGRVHDGFFGALFHGDPEAGCLFDQLVETLEAADAGAGRAIYLTGGPGDRATGGPRARHGSALLGLTRATQSCVHGFAVRIYSTCWKLQSHGQRKPLRLCACCHIAVTFCSGSCRTL